MGEEQTMDQIAAAAAWRANLLLERARAALKEAATFLKEANSPVFTNGIAKGLREELKSAEASDGNLQNLQILIAKQFRGESDGDRG